MLFGGKKEPAQQTAAASVPPGGNIFDTKTDSFEADVIRASMTTPVLVDFWAPWCGPCKQLGPVLESAVNAAGGKVKMAKINIDENPELAQAMRAQSVPTVFAFFQGQPVTAFTGARPASEIKMLIDQLSKMATQAKPDALNVPETLTLAAKAMAEGDVQKAQALYAQILAQDENDVAAYGGLVRSFIATGDLEQAQYMIEDAPEAIIKNPQFAAIKTAVEVAASVPGAAELGKLEKAVAKDENDHQARFDYALALFGAGQHSAAIDQLLDIMRRDRGWEDDKARAQIVKFFDAMGPSDPETVAGRRKLSTLLFS
jgi:putative thioredoxin